MPRTRKPNTVANEVIVKKVKDKLDKYIEENNIDDPRKQMFLELYFNPASPTFSNGYKSAIEAGFSPHYAKMILSKNANGWIQDFQQIFREKIANKAEIRLWELMHSDSDKVAADMTKFALKTLKKDTYSEKITDETTHIIKHQLDDEQVNRIISRMNAIRVQAS